MSAWSFEVTDGRLDNLPTALVGIVEEQRSLGAECFLLAEAGHFLNEPEQKLIVPIKQGASPSQVIARVGQAYSWLFGLLECEIDQNFQWDFLKLSFVNLSPLWLEEEGDISGKMTTNSPRLPAACDQPPALILRQLVMTLRIFFCRLQASVEVSDLGGCDWVTMTFCKAG